MPAASTAWEANSSGRMTRGTGPSVRVRSSVSTLRRATTPSGWAKVNDRWLAPPVRVQDGPLTISTPSSHRPFGLTRPSRGGRLLLEGSHVDHEAVLHVTSQEPLVGLVDLLDRDQLGVRHDAALGAEVEHLLGLGDAADPGPGELAARQEEAEGGDRQRLLGGTHQAERAVELQKLEVGVDVVPGRYTVEDEVEARFAPGHLARVLRHHDLVRAEALAVLDFARRGGEQHDPGA